MICASIDDEHAVDATAHELKHRVQHVGQLKDVSPEIIAAAAAKAYEAPDLLSPINAWDCMGVYRVARWLFELEDWASDWPPASWAWWRERPAVPLTKAE